MSSARHELTTVILAAGAAQRFGDCKHLLVQGGKSLLQHRVDAVLEAGLSNPLIVTGAWHNAIEQMHPHLNLKHHHNWHQGLGSSIAFAMGCVPENARAVLLLLGDQVAVSNEEIAQLHRRWRQQTDKVVCAHYQHAPGVPAVFPRSLFPALRELDGDRGAKALLEANANSLHTIPMPSAAIDIDTPEDWQRWQNTQHELTEPLTGHQTEPQTRPENSGDALWN
ncbi:NTP transferase domain-containing protein [Microbulbifer sp. HZ11]|uniref:nucleotidyltransferase family protein n=1 Tax=Microbulbifer sp. HZ11 TaxID=1453501 RepID=UPI0005BC01B4|nr:nucleotidyltransferase family protein [Microbulbifer sp. HZ11]